MIWMAPKACYTRFGRKEKAILSPDESRNSYF